MDFPTLKANRRTKIGTNHVRKLRAEGLLPGIIYGHGETPEAFSVGAHDAVMELGHGARLVQLDMGGKKSQYLIKDIQYDHMGKLPIHMDLARVNLDEKIRVRVVIELRGVPKGIQDGGILDQLLDNIEIECLASGIPETLHPNVAELDVGETLTVKDLKLPEGVTAVTGPDEKIAMVHLLSIVEETTEEGEGEVDEAAASAEPERIGRIAEDKTDDKDKGK